MSAVELSTTLQFSKVLVQFLRFIYTDVALCEAKYLRADAPITRQTTEEFIIKIRRLPPN